MPRFHFFVHFVFLSLFLSSLCGSILIPRHAPELPISFQRLEGLGSLGWGVPLMEAVANAAGGAVATGG